MANSRHIVDTAPVLQARIPLKSRAKLDSRAHRAGVNLSDYLAAQVSAFIDEYGEIAPSKIAEQSNPRPTGGRPELIRATVSAYDHEAMIALAERYGCSPSALLRAVVLDHARDVDPTSRERGKRRRESARERSARLVREYDERLDQRREAREDFGWPCELCGSRPGRRYTCPQCGRPTNNPAVVDAIVDQLADASP